MTDIAKLVKRLRVLSERQMGMGTSEPSDHIAWEAADALEAQVKRIAELEKREKHLEEMFEGWRDEAIKASARIAEQDYLLEMKWRAEDRAIKAWQEETGEHLTWPDQAKLVEWLMDELDAARAALNGEME